MLVLEVPFDDTVTQVNLPRSVFGDIVLVRHEDDRLALFVDIDQG